MVITCEKISFGGDILLVWKLQNTIFCGNFAANINTKKTSKWNQRKTLKS